MIEGTALEGVGLGISPFEPNVADPAPARPPDRDLDQRPGQVDPEGKTVRSEACRGQRRGPAAAADVDHGVRGVDIRSPEQVAIEGPEHRVVAIDMADPVGRLLAVPVLVLVPIRDSCGRHEL